MAAARLSEVPEQDADPATRAIYADIKASLDVPMVNLVFRHMATVPGCLRWAWATLRPLYLQGRMTAAGRELTAAVLPGAAAPLARGDLAAAGLGQAEQRQVTAVLDAYARANPMNAVGLLVLARSLDAPAAAARAPAFGGEPLRPDPGLEPLVPMLDLDAASPSVAAMLERLAAQLHGAGSAVIPSLYRHLAHWPGLLVRLERALEPVVATPGFRAAAGEMLAAADERARTLAAGLALPDLPPPSAATRDTLRSLAATFPPNICAMTVLATLLRRGLAPGGEAGA